MSIAEAQSKADKLALARKKLKDFESRRARDGTHSPVPSIGSSLGGEINNGRHSEMSNHSSGGHGHSHSHDSSVEKCHDVSSSYSNNIYDGQQHQMMAYQGAESNPISQIPEHLILRIEEDSQRSSPAHPLVNGGGENASASTVSLRPTSSSPYFNGYSVANPSFQQSSEKRLIQERDAALAAHEQLKKQMEELHNHYSQLHAAYSQISVSGTHTDAERQIQQLQSALAVLVEEKATLQSELRNSKEAHAIAKKATPVETDKSVSNEELKLLKAKLSERDRLLEDRNGELDSLRRAAATAQAELLSVQHERSEAQSRLKVVAREGQSMEAEVANLRKELNMKELYLRQLGAHQTHGANPVDEETLKNLHARIESYEAAMTALSKERDAARAAADEARTHYNAYGKEMSDKHDRLTSMLDDAVMTRIQSDSRIQELENELAVLKQDASTVAVDGRISVHGREIASGMSEEGVAKEVADAVTRAREAWLAEVDEQMRRVEDRLADKDRALFEQEQSMAELALKYRLLEERTNESMGSSADMLALSEQLQNEKATVSRAVAQNKELKEQLIETEDRLVALTEEKLQSELARQTAEHQVKELTRNMSLHAAGLIDSPVSLEEVLHPSNSVVPRSPATPSSTNQMDDADNSYSMETERRLDLERELEQTRNQLAELRNELRRSHNENEEMNQIMRQNAEDENQNSIHVELGQAVARIHALAAENQRLREDVTRHELQQQEWLQQQKEEEQVRQSSTITPSVKSEENNITDNNLSNGVNPKSPVGTPEWAQKELEQRFEKSMRQVAEMTEAMEKLEHINMQLQLENDTIADHVVLYQHQRRLIRERLRAKDVQLASLETERLRVAARCQELQQALMTVLEQTGALKEYDVNPVVRKGHKTKRRASRSYSHSTVDELSGDEDIVIDGKNQEVPRRIGKQGSIEEERKADGDVSESAEEGRASPVTSTVSSESPTTSTKAAKDLEKEATVQRILQIITDISRPAGITATDKLQCTQCIGELHTL